MHARMPSAKAVWRQRISQFCLDAVQWVTVGDVEVDIGANPSAEGEDGEEGVDSTSRKVVDLIDGF